MHVCTHACTHRQTSAHPVIPLRPQVLLRTLPCARPLMFLGKFPQTLPSIPQGNGRRRTVSKLRQDPRASSDKIWVTLSRSRRTPIAHLAQTGVCTATFTIRSGLDGSLSRTLSRWIVEQLIFLGPGAGLGNACWREMRSLAFCSYRYLSLRVRRAITLIHFVFCQLLSGFVILSSSLS